MGKRGKPNPQDLRGSGEEEKENADWVFDFAL
jgi:hypothetical protein